MSKRRQSFGSVVGDRANPVGGRLSQRSQPIRCRMGERRDLVSGCANPISGDSSERPDSVGGGLRERPYSISCGVDQRSDTISGRMDKVLGGWRDLLRAASARRELLDTFPPL